MATRSSGASSGGQASSPVDASTSNVWPKAPSKARSFFTRTISTIVLVGLFVGIMWAGHIPCALLMFSFQVRVLCITIECFHTKLTFQESSQFVSSRRSLSESCSRSLEILKKIRRCRYFGRSSGHSFSCLLSTCTEGASVGSQLELRSKSF
jgi:hypothetical protein